MILTPKRILILKPSSLGDVIHALPTLSALRRFYPSANISWLIKHEWAEILEGNPDLDEVIPVSFNVWHWPSLIYRVRQGKFDLVVDLQGLLRTALIAGLSGASERIGFAAGREGSPWFYTKRVKLPLPMERPWRLLDMHAVDRNLCVAQYLGADISDPTFFIPHLETDQTDVAQHFLSAGVRSYDRLVAMAPLSREEVKCWPLDRFVDVAQKICHWPNYKVVVLGSFSQRWMLKKFSHIEGNKVIDMVGKLRIRQLGTLLRRTNLLIANDSAPIHIAAGVGVPVLGVFGPTYAVATGPYGTGDHRVKEAALPCRPCGKTTCYHVTHKECLTAISVEEVMSLATNMLESSGISRSPHEIQGGSV